MYLVRKKLDDLYVKKTISFFSLGAYFGLAVAFVLFHSNVLNSSLEKSRYTSDLFSIIGTMFLFCFWPSFNAGTTNGVERLHAITNTYVSICASVIGAFIMSTVVRKGKLDMVHIQNSTLAGGVAVGTVATSDIGLHGAMIIGTLAGMISVLGFHLLLPQLQRIRVHDTCGVNNLHGMPGLMAGIAGIIIVFSGNRSGYLNHLTDVCLSGGKQRTSNIQSGYQAAALVLTLCMAIVGGLITGLILRLPMFVQNFENFEDEPNWHLPDVGEPGNPSGTGNPNETGIAGSLNPNLDRRFSIIPPAIRAKNLQRRFSVFPD
jgi:ammonium transporter Rh